MEGNEKKSALTVNRVLKILALLCIIFVFCPVFTVSCSGQNMNISVMTVVGGVRAYGEQIVNPYPIMLICLVLPIAILVLLFMKKLPDKKTALITFICSLADLVIWFIFRACAKYAAEENYCSFKSTGWFVVNIIVLILMMIPSILVVLHKLELESDLIAAITGNETKQALNQMSTTVNQMSNAVTKMTGDIAKNIGNKRSKENIIGYCAKCGSPIEMDCKFCTSCGTPVPESMIEEAKAARKAAEEEAARKAAEEATRKKAEEEAAKKAAEEAAAKKAAEEAEAMKKAAEDNENVVSSEPKPEETNASEAEATNNADQNAEYCPACGAKLDSDAKFCKSCGTKVR